MLHEPSSHADPAGAGRLQFLDALRFAAALAVVAYHYLYRSALPGGFLDVSYGEAGGYISFGYLGVNLFFMISGFVIIWSAESRGWYEFSVSRFARLYPAHLVAMTLTALVTALWATPPYVTSFAQWAANLTMLAPLFGQPFMDGAYWSIALEIVFYGWVALCLLAGILPRHVEAFVAAWLAIILLNTLALESRAVQLAFATNFGACFCFGIMVWRLGSKGFSLLRVGLAGLALAMTFQAAERHRLVIIEDFGVEMSAAGVATANGIIVLLFLGAVLARSAERRLSRSASAWIALAGGISYPLYLIHQNAGYIIINATAPSLGKWTAAGLALFLSLAASWLLWRYVEPDGRRLIRALLAPLGRYLPRKAGDRVGRPGLAPAE